MGDRILWNAGRKIVDEIVVRDCMVHLEEMDDGQWYLAMYPASQPDARVMLSISGSVAVVEEIAWDADEEHAPVAAWAAALTKEGEDG